jgi:hypothetical protein
VATKVIERGLVNNNSNNIILKILRDIMENYGNFSDYLKSNYPRIIVDIISIIDYEMDTKGINDKDIHPDLVRYFFLRSLASPVIFLISIGISFINIQLTQFFWALIFPVGIIIYMKHIPHLSKL